MLLIFFLISFDYNVLRVMKDTLVVTAKNSGAEVIPFIKVWVMFPGAILMTYLFTRLSNRLKRESVFYVMLSLFLGYFFLFTFVLYPIRDALHPNASADALEKILPIGLKGMIAMYRNWTFTSFYVMSELWSSVILSMLFWGFANQVTRINEAKRFYGLFGIGANLSGVFAGQAAVALYLETYNPALPFGADAWEQSMIMLVVLVLIAGVAAMAIFRWVNTRLLTDPLYYDSDEAYKEGRVQGRLSMRESVAFLLRSKYLICIALIVVSYNLVINLTEVVWKHQVKELYTSPHAYNLYMSQVTTVIGIVATLSALFISGNAIRRCGWTFTAMLTPVILLLTSIGFFGFLFFRESLEAFMLTALGTTPLALAVFFGSAQNIMSRGAKYSVFDATKEMSFVPLNTESQVKAKAVIDGVCSRLGKSGGSVIHQTLLLTLSSISASTPYVAGFLLVLIVLWICAVSVLGKQFKLLTTQPSSEGAVSVKEEPVMELARRVV